MATILAIESTCDETGAAVVSDGWNVRSNVVASQIDLHARYRGVVPEIASRAHIENILPVVRDALDQAACGFADIDAIAVAHRPGLIGSLLIGVTAAKTLAWSLGKPLIGVDHVHAHLYSVMLGGMSDEATKPRSDEGWGQDGNSERDSFPASSSAPPSLRRSVASSLLVPAVGLVCSGGHTALYRVNSWTDIALIGSTIDDAVGEAYDKVAAILGLGYPGGPVIDKLAAEGDPKAIHFPRSMLGRESLDFSFSGLKTAVLYHVRGVPGKHETPPPLNDRSLRDVCASFQAACIDTLIKKLQRASKQTNARSIIIGGGVSANRGLRAAMRKFPLPSHFPPMQYCTDNAAMSGGLAQVLLDGGKTAELDLDAITYSQFANG
jgi:N6-L-threonylcarbamoyladenine synthase